MRDRFLALLHCPNCRGELRIAKEDRREDDALVDGTLVCAACNTTWPVRGRIPRFVPDSGYADNFGWEWNRFPELQRDSYNGTEITRRTILHRSRWMPEFLNGKTLIEFGCGSGNDTEVLADLCGSVVSLDISSSVDAMLPDLLKRPNLLVLQADLLRPPLREKTFQIGYCHRVIQHTPDPSAAFRRMSAFVAPGGAFFLHSYDTDPKSMRQFKYWLRPMIRTWPHEKVYKWLTRVGPVLYPIVGTLNLITLLRRPTGYLIPFENFGRYLKKNGTTLSLRERYEYSLLVTFDGLTAVYDKPNPPETVVRWFEAEGFVDIKVNSRHPTIVVGRKMPMDKSVLQTKSAQEAQDSRLLT